MVDQTERQEQEPMAAQTEQSAQPRLERLQTQVAGVVDETTELRQAQAVQA